MFGRSFLILFAGTLLASGAGGEIQRIDSIGITVSDLDRSVEFYSQVLHFQKVSEFEAAGDEWEHLTGVFGLRMRTARMRLGDEFIELTEYLAPQGRPIPQDSRANDRWFQHIAIITSDMDRAYKWLRENKVRHASSGPQALPAWNQNAAGIQAFYFKDPDGHSLEVLAFPADKGAAKWHKASGDLFLGIDHTAIVISNTEASTNFYENVLGFHVAGESENYGSEQEHLNNVFGARLRITAMRLASDNGQDAGPGIEFLEYLAPSDGRPYPADAKANDLIHWQTRLQGTNVAETANRLRKFRSAFVSAGVVNVPGNAPGKSIIVRDPDGHAIQLVER